MRPRSFAAAAVLSLGVAVSVTACGGQSRHPRTVGSKLSIYTSLPFEGPYASQAGAIYDGEELALAQAGGVVNGAKVILRRRDDSSPGTGSSATRVAQSAQTAAADPSTIAYIGELTPGSSPTSIRTLSEAGILQVSPGDTATGLSGTTFARVVPPDSAEAQAQLHAMQKLGVKSVYLVKDRTTYGRDIAAAIVTDAAGDGIVVVDPLGRYLRSDPRALVQKIKKSKAGAMLYAGSPGAAVAPFWDELSAADGSVKKFASAAITSTPGWAQTTAAARYDTYLSAPGLPRLPRAGTQFQTDFVSAYGSRVPWASGIFGYVAMSGVLEALHSLGPRPTDARAQVARAFLRLRDQPSALGPYSIVGGETSFSSYIFITYNRLGGEKTYIPGAA